MRYVNTKALNNNNNNKKCNHFFCWASTSSAQSRSTTLQRFIEAHPQWLIIKGRLHIKNSPNSSHRFKLELTIDHLQIHFITMYSFNPFRKDITSSELFSFMHHNFPMVTFDENSSITELQTIAKKWIDLGDVYPCLSDYFSSDKLTVLCWTVNFLLWSLRNPCFSAYQEDITKFSVRSPTKEVV